MKSVFRVLLLALLFLRQPVTAAETRRVPGSSRGAGRGYVRITEWARDNRLEVRWLKRDESLELSSPSARVVLTVDSREAQFNGVQVWLSHPVARFSDVLHVSQTDLRTALRPLLFPPRIPPSTRVLSVCIDPGHGGKDPGNQVGSNQEKKFTLLLARELRDQLSRSGIKTTLTRTTDRFIELPERSEFANKRKADLFLCLHFNSASTSRAFVKGAEVYCLAPAGAGSTNSQRDQGNADSCVGNRNDDRNVFLAFQIQKALTRSLSVEDRGVRRARFAVLRDAAMPAALIEAGFMSHPAEGQKIFTSEYRRQLARAITDGVLAYKRGVEK